jgi:hypothetical protein
MMLFIGEIATAYRTFKLCSPLKGLIDSLVGERRMNHTPASALFALNMIPLISSFLTLAVWFCRAARCPANATAAK